jgi:hypothetical protein
VRNSSLPAKNYTAEDLLQRQNKEIAPGRQRNFWYWTKDKPDGMITG